ncbi:MAG: hypothetical protein WHX53_06830 [Anaerolineae bacterium]
MPQPLPLPENYDPQTHLLAKVTENGVFHETRAGAAFAHRLVANGTPQDLALAEQVLDVVLGCQERRPGDPHFGNFTWMLEDDHVEDLNAVEFNLEHLIPMMLCYADRLTPAMRTRVLEAIRLGLDEIRRLDVSIAYTNICLLDVLNTSLGGELLGERAIAERGYRKLAAWMAFTDSQGTVFEWNSPTYGAVDIRALKQLADLTRDDETRIRARTAAARLGLSIALHIHAATGRWAGPHGRAYHPSVVCETPAEIGRVREWIADGTLPAWIADALTARPERFEIVETAHAGRQMGLTTYHSRSFVLGTASKEYTGQSDVLMAHWVREGAERPGVLYTRYLTNDKWLGDFYHATDRTRTRNLIEEGQFYGVQNGPRAIGLYTPPRNPGVISSAKACFIFVERQSADEIWIGGRRIEALPADVAPGEVIVVGSGAAWIAIWPLARTDLGRAAPIRLVEREGDLVLEIYNYLGPKKAFWELNWPGLFYKGRPQCGVYVELAERSEYPDGETFGRVVASGELRDVTASPFTYYGEGERPWTVEYRRGGQALGIEVDLMEWRLKRRWTERGEIGWPMLESPVARQSASGRVEVGDAVLECAAGPAWLFASPATGRYVAGYHGAAPTKLTLIVPGDRVEVPDMGIGTVVWDNGQVTVSTR